MPHVFMRARVEGTSRCPGMKKWVEDKQVSASRVMP